MKQTKAPQRPPEEPLRCCLIRCVHWKPGSPAACLTHHDYAIGMHTHEFLEINFVLRGRGRHYIEAESFPVQPGDTFVIPTAVRHGYVGGKGLDVYHLLLHPDFIRRNLTTWRQVPGFAMLFTIERFFGREAANGHGLRLDARGRREALELLRKIEWELKVDTPGWDLAVEGLLHYLLVLLCREYTNQQPTPHRRSSTRRPLKGIQASLELAAVRYADKVTLDDFAGAAHLERSYFCRIFRKMMGLTPMEHLQQVRVEAARKLLREKDWPTSRIAQETGFCDGPHLARIFTRVAGVPPSEFRRQYLAQPMR